MYSVEFNVNPTVLSDFSLKVFNDSQGGFSRANLSTTLIVDVIKITTLVAMKVKTNEDSNEFDKVIFKGNIDTCKVSKGIFGNFFVQMIAENLDKHSNFSFECPQKKAFYHATNFPVDAKYIPYYILGKPQIWEVSATLKAKLANIKSMVHVVTVKIYGQLWTLFINLNTDATKCSIKFIPNNGTRIILFRSVKYLWMAISSFNQRDKRFF